MVVEAVAAALAGLAALWLVLRPLFEPRQTLPPAEPVDLEETPRGIALAALKEIDFDRETGKLSESDYQMLKAKYTAAALEALRTEAAAGGVEPLEAVIAARVRARTAQTAAKPNCVVCGPRPELDALFCSTCGQRLDTRLEADGASMRRPSPETLGSRPAVL